MTTSDLVQRPGRWDVALSTEMSDDIVNRLMGIEPFSKMDRNKFRGNLSLEGIIRNDTRLLECQTGDIIVRQGHWGSSAFFILSGSVCVSIDAASTLSNEILGRKKTERKGFLKVLAQLWSNPSTPEVRNVRRYQQDSRVAVRGSGRETRIYLQDVSAVLDNERTATLEQGQFFGEQAALGRFPHPATVFASSEATLLEIRWQGLRDMMRRDANLRNHIDQIFRQRGLRSFLRNAPICQQLNEGELAEVIDQAEFKL